MHGPSIKRAAKGAVTAVALGLFSPSPCPADDTGTPNSYAISQDHACLQKGEEACVSRFPEVTGNGGDGPAQVGGTPLANPFNPGACSGGGPKGIRNPAKEAAYSSWGYDPNNSGNADRYGVTRCAPIQGWPGEFHLLPDKNHLAWRHSLILRAHKAGARTLEADNSDLPCAPLSEIAAQLNRECKLLQALGHDCPLKNNFPVLSQLDHTPTFWFIETGEGNEGNKHIQEAKASKVAPSDIYIVHYGPVSDSVCKMIPGAHVVFSSSLDLSVANLSVCPGAPKGGAKASPPPSQPSCAKNESEPPRSIPSPVFGQSLPTSSTITGTEKARQAAKQASAASSTGGAERRQRGATARSLPLGPPEEGTPSTVTNRTAPFGMRGNGAMPDTLSASGGRERFSAQALSKTVSGGERREPASAGSIESGSAARASGNLGGPGGAMRGSPPTASAASSAGAGDTLSAFKGATLGDPKISVKAAEIESAKGNLIRGLSAPGINPSDPSSLSSTASEAESAELASLFVRVHDAHTRRLLGGSLSPR